MNWKKYNSINDLPGNNQFLLWVRAEHSGSEFAEMCVVYNNQIVKMSGLEISIYGWTPLYYMIIEKPE